MIMIRALFVAVVIAAPIAVPISRSPRCRRRSPSRGRVPPCRIAPLAIERPNASSRTETSQRQRLFSRAWKGVPTGNW
jgi:hypothetical protein